MAQRYTVPARMRTQTNGSGTRRAQDSSQYGHHLTGPRSIARRRTVGYLIEQCIVCCA